jgi:hypothetical protein
VLAAQRAEWEEMLYRWAYNKAVALGAEVL